MYFAILLIVIGSAFWTYSDARQQIRSGRQLEPISSPGGWFWACVLLWIVFFPWYLVKKSQSPNPAEPTLARVVEQVTEPLAKQEAFSGSVADELRKFAELRDDGVITPEEFDEQRARLLGK